MPRPALAATRGTQITDFLAMAPDRRFSLTDIARATGVNPASCLAILGELTSSGHLCRHPARKTYWLGPVLIAAGSAAMAANPLLGRARTAADGLRADLGLPVLLSTRVGEEIACVFSLADDAGRNAGLWAGERVPLIPPVGASFVAWAAPDAAEAWIARRADVDVRQLRETLTLTRQRGFHVTWRRQGSEDIASTLARAMAGPQTDPQRSIAASADRLDAEASQPDMLAGDVTYDVQSIAAPVIDPDTAAVYNLCLGGFAKPLAGTAIADLGRRLTTACVDIMRG